MRNFKSYKNYKNLVVLMEPYEEASDISLNGGNMILNRFCIDEDAAFELSVVNYLKKWSHEIMGLDPREFKLKREEKGKENYDDLILI